MWSAWTVSLPASTRTARDSHPSRSSPHFDSISSDAYPVFYLPFRSAVTLACSLSVLLCLPRAWRIDCMCIGPMIRFRPGTSRGLVSLYWAFIFLNDIRFFWYLLFVRHVYISLVLGGDSLLSRHFLGMAPPYRRNSFPTLFGPAYLFLVLMLGLFCLYRLVFPPGFMCSGEAPRGASGIRVFASCLCLPFVWWRNPGLCCS